MLLVVLFIIHRFVPLVFTQQAKLAQVVCLVVQQKTDEAIYVLLSHRNGEGYR